MPESSRPEASHEAPRGNRFRVSLSQVVVALLIGALAFAIMVQTRDDGTDDYSNVRGENLVELLKSLDSANERLTTQIDDLTETRDGLLSSTKRSERAEKQARKRAEELAILAGAVGATGSGIQIVISDPDREVDAAALLDAVEELRDAGAEVIAINGVARVVAQTYFLDDEDEIRVGGRQLKRPYRIEAIGDAASLAKAANFPGGLVDGIRARGAAVVVSEEKKITITALADLKTPEYAQSTS